MEIETKPDTRFEKKQPQIEHNISLSKDKKWLILSTTIKEIVHVNYMNKIIGNGE